MGFYSALGRVNTTAAALFLDAGALATAIETPLSAGESSAAASAAAPCAAAPVRLLFALGAGGSEAAYTSRPPRCSFLTGRSSVASPAVSASPSSSATLLPTTILKALLTVHEISVATSTLVARAIKTSGRATASAPAPSASFGCSEKRGSDVMESQD